MVSGLEGEMFETKGSLWEKSDSQFSIMREIWKLD